MMHTTFTRLIMLAGLILLGQGGFYLVGIGMGKPVVRMPARALQEFPGQLGEWRGKDVQIDPAITAATEAASSITRSYQDSNGHAISMHLALFDDPDRGVYHSPTNCYRAQGWARLGGRDVSLQVPGRPTIQVRLSTWQREGDKILVLYWYELGENVLFERIDMGAVRWKMRGRATWPPMVKVLLQTSAAEAGLAQSQLLQIAAQIRQWVGQMDPPASGDKNPQAGEQQ